MDIKAMMATNGIRNTSKADPGNLEIGMLQKAVGAKSGKEHEPVGGLILFCHVTHCFL